MVVLEKLGVAAALLAEGLEVSLAVETVAGITSAK
jgi:hypothetical protein